MSRKNIASLTVIAFIIFSSLGFAGPIEDCAEYAKLGVPGSDGTILCRTGHLLAHSSELKTPIWVIERLTAEKANAKGLDRDSFRPDPSLKKRERAEVSDYEKSGYDTGHMAPQVGIGMNRGIWRILEEKIRDWAINRGELYIFTGPIYDGGAKQTIGKNKVAVPTHFYKISYDPKKNEAIAFIMPNEPLETSDMPKYIVTVRDVESRTGLDFLSGLEREIQDDVETKKAAELWQNN